MPNQRRAVGARVFLAFAAAVLVGCMAASSAGARSGAWRANTFQVTRAGVFHADFLMPKWFEVGPFVVQIVGSKHLSHCTLRYGTTTDRAGQIAAPYVHFVWPVKGASSASRARATCHVAGGRVASATVFLPLGMRESRIPLRRR